ncbi:MAG: biotin--[acetyl-CoA-carboxylase] ligase [Holosporaceae bacterium]|jgi:BirA family biotin operon repressor/biotin-[acetyl-CoA-carboxylase] ligase|nr:biotin--[acetyl-CoA-carboxylase] ligase [Holosporaceae bacterium]
MRLKEKIIRLKTVDSSHKLAVRLVEGGKAEECAIVAEVQTDGVGRCGGRRWESPKGTISLSVIRKIPPHKEFGRLSLAVGVAVHEAILRYVPSELYLHWPNDVYYKNSKVAGILIAVIDSWAIISAGINVNSAPNAANSACLKDARGSEIPLEELLECVLAGLRERFDNFDPGKFSFIKDYWLRFVKDIGRKVTIKNGVDSIEGIFKGIDDSGRLILEKDGRNAFISSGDMFLNTESVTVNYE